jgi:outer membrane protein OmpA-like peptidoglycan-associated protein
MNKDFFGGPSPFDGSACIGIFCYRVNPLRGIFDIREYIQVDLRESLKKDSIYEVSLYISLDKESNMAINNFHILFTGERIKEKHERKMFEKRPQIKFRKNYFMSPDWVKLKKKYKARGDEKVIILGNFYSDRRLSTKKTSFINRQNKEMKWNLGEKERAAYYYIDLVSVTPYKSREIPVDQDSISEHVTTPVLDSATNEDQPFNIDEIDNDTSIVLKNILFEFDKAILLPGSFKELQKLYRLLIENENIKIKIEGHTDNIGSHEYNMALSRRRAKAVSSYLIDKGISRNRISWEGFGKTRPVTNNKTEEGRKLNRRVAFRVIER